MKNRLVTLRVEHISSLLLLLLTINGQLGFVGIVGAKVIGDNALIPSFISEVHIEKMQDSGVLNHLTTLLLIPGKILNLCIIQDFAVLTPGCGHGWITAAHSSASQSHIHASQSNRGLRMYSYLRFREVIWKEKHQY